MTREVAIRELPMYAREPIDVQVKMSLLREVLQEQAERTEWLEHKYPWVEILRNWVCVILLAFALIYSGIYWAVNTYNDKLTEAKEAGKTEAVAEATLQKEDEEAKKKEEYEKLINAETDAVAQMFFGIRKFQEMYHYTDKDMETYAQSAFNRAVARGQDLITVIFEDGQYTACSKFNDITIDFQNLARPMVIAWHENKDPECDTAFQYAELTPYGIYLKKSYGDERWHS